LKISFHLFREKCFVLKFITISAFLSVIISGFACLAEERVPDGAELSYTYSVWKESVASPYAYLPQEVVSAGLSSPADLYVRGKEVYVLDSGNNRILVLDDSLSPVRSVSPQKNVSLNGAAGIFVAEDGSIYIAIPEEESVVILNSDGELKNRIGRPKSAIVPDSMVYKPKRVALGNDGNINVVAEGCYFGMAVFNTRGEFLRFFGSNKVSASVESFIASLKDIFLNEDQKRKTERILPAEYSSMDIDNEGFFYSVITKATGSTSQVKKHSPSGENILPSNDGFGDLETSIANGTVVTSSLTDIAVDDDGFIFVADSQRNKVFNYSQRAELLSVFGTTGNIKGAFTELTAVDTLEGKCLVLDKKTGLITVFAPTDYGAMLRQSILLYNDQQYEKSGELWEEIRQLNNNFEMAYTGIGKTAYGMGDYERAMECFRIARNRNDYNLAFRAYRSQKLQTWFPFLFAAAAAIMAIVWVLVSRKVKRAAAGYIKVQPDRPVTPFYTMLHPAAGFESLKSEHRGSILYASILIGAVLLIRLAGMRYTSFLFNSYRIEAISLGSELMQVAAVFLIWIATSWATASFIDGEGTFREIYMGSSYALLPYALSTSVNIVLSGMISLDEAAIYNGISALGIYWSAALLFLATMKIQRYSFKKTIGSLLIQMLMIVFICFLGVLAYSLLGQFGSFIKTVFTELSFRLQ